jgi:1,4-dihydroxy-2-naphthoyl-CoA synthase
MNELAFMYACHFEEDNLNSSKLPEIIKSMNRVIMGMVNGYSVDAFRALG